MKRCIDPPQSCTISRVAMGALATTRSMAQATITVRPNPFCTPVEQCRPICTRAPRRRRVCAASSGDGGEIGSLERISAWVANTWSAGQESRVLLLTGAVIIVFGSVEILIRAGRLLDEVSLSSESIWMLPTQVASPWTCVREVLAWAFADSNWHRNKSQRGREGSYGKRPREDGDSNAQAQDASRQHLRRAKASLERPSPATTPD